MGQQARKKRLKRQERDERTPSADHEAPLALREIPTPAETRARFDRIALASGETERPYLRSYRLGECVVIITREYGRWHLSISARDRYPTWHEISQARYRLLPDDAFVAMVLPPRSEYVNVNKNVFQMIEIENPDLDLERRRAASRTEAEAAAELLPDQAAGALPLDQAGAEAPQHDPRSETP